MKRILNVWCVEKAYGLIIRGQLDNKTNVCEGDTLPELLNTVLHDGQTLMNIGDTLEICFVEAPGQLADDPIEYE